MTILCHHYSLSPLSFTLHIILTPTTQTYSIMPLLYPQPHPHLLLPLLIQWGYFSNTVVYSFNKPDRIENCVMFWNTKSRDVGIFVFYTFDTIICLCVLYSMCVLRFPTKLPQKSKRIY